jgi:hypothetical protein
MIKRYLTRCLTCGHNNTLRVTLGAEPRQEHTFGCAGCGENVRIALELDFKNRESYELAPGRPFTYPTPTFFPLLNCELDRKEGTITNLDPNFLVPEEILHTDRVFPWMYAVKQPGITPSIPAPSKLARDQREGPIVLDILHEVGIPRFMSMAMQTFCQLWRFHRRGDALLVGQSLRRFEEITHCPVDEVWDVGATLALMYLGKRADADLDTLTRELSDIRNANPLECDRFRSFVREEGILMITAVPLISTIKLGFTHHQTPYPATSFSLRLRTSDPYAFSTAKRLSSCPRPFFGAPV